MRKLRIGQIGPLNVPIPPVKYGGTERVIDVLCRGLTKRGHDVFLFAARDSRTDANLIPIISKSLWRTPLKEVTPYYAYEMSIVARESNRLKLDVLHDHLGPWSLALYGGVNIPLVHTLHVPLNPDRVWAYKKLNARLVSISNNQRKPGPNLNYLATIYNGIDTIAFQFNEKPLNHFLFMGELSRHKGILEAIHVAKSTKVKLLVAGRIPSAKQKEDFAFFKRFVKPELGKNNITYIGEISSKRMSSVYGKAIATLFPIKWEEPFGLVMTESMACGTPVIAFRRGSVPEVIDHGKTGFIVGSRAGMIRALKKIDHIERRNCRLHVEKHFSVEHMVDRYEEEFLKIVKHR